MQTNKNFITFEGIDGSGKSTHINLVKTKLEAAGKKVLLTREPGGTKSCEMIRELVLNNQFCAESQLMLFQAARCQHLESVIIPALNNGYVVLCDRYIDSTLAYQGALIDINIIEQIHRLTTFKYNELGFYPEKTILMLLDPAKASKRVETRDEEENLFDKMSFEEFLRIQANFENIASKNPERIKRIITSGSVDETHSLIMNALV